MNNNQQNPNWNPNNQEGSKGNMPNEGNANPQMNMANMPVGSMPGQNMQFPPGMMPYGMPNFMSHLQMGNMPQNPNMAGGMYPGAPGMMPQDGSNAPNNASSDQNQAKPEENSNNPPKPAGAEENNQAPAAESQVEKREANPEAEPTPGGEGKALDENAITQGAIQENPPASAAPAPAQAPSQAQPQQQPQTQGQVPTEQQPQNMPPQHLMGENSKENMNEGEDEDGKYNLRKRSRKELPHYYCELSDDENKGDGRKRQKKGEEDYDPDQDEENEERRNKQNAQNAANANGGQGFGMQNQMNPAMMNQMMMQQMGGNPMMGMPNLNDTSANLNNMNNMMGGQFSQNPMGQQNYPNNGQNSTQVQEKSGGCGGAKEGPGGICTHCNKPKPPPELLAQILSLQNNRTAQMMQGINDPSQYMMGGGAMMPGMPNQGFNGAGANQTSGQTPGQNMSNNQYTMQTAGSAGQTNATQQDPSKMQSNQMNQPGFNMMDGRSGGNSMPPGGSGSNDMNNFGGANAMGMNPMMGGGQSMGQFPPGAGGNNMNGMGGFPQGYSMNGNGSGQNSQGNGQNMTQEQMQQMMQRQMMQGGQGPWMNNMNPNGN